MQPPEQSGGSRFLGGVESLSPHFSPHCDSAVADGAAGG